LRKKIALMEMDSLIILDEKESDGFQSKMKAHLWLLVEQEKG